MRRTTLLLCLSLLAVGALLLETFRLAELAGRGDVAVRAAAAAAAQRGAEAAAATARAAELTATVQRLEGELLAARQREGALLAAVEAQRAAAERAAAAAAAREAAALQPPPPGVVACLQQLHECLRAEGYAGYRFLSARRLDAEGLHDVELLVAEPDGFASSLLQAERMTADLDRGEGVLELRFFGGHRRAGGAREPLPKDGHALRFQPVDARVVEASLPFLVRCHGVHAPPPADPRAPQPTDLDPLARRHWLTRFDRLLDGAGVVPAFRVHQCRGLADGWFLGVQLLGTDDRRRLVATADAARLCVEVDEAAGVVSLRLCDGVLHRDGVPSTIAGEGYRMLLPNVTPQQAIDTMLGMVVRK